jgi:hypothetical protein
MTAALPTEGNRMTAAVRDRKVASLQIRPRVDGNRKANLADARDEIRRLRVAIPLAHKVERPILVTRLAKAEARIAALGGTIPR